MRRALALGVCLGSLAAIGVAPGGVAGALERAELLWQRVAGVAQGAPWQKAPRATTLRLAQTPESTSGAERWALGSALEGAPGAAVASLAHGAEDPAALSVAQQGDAPWASQLQALDDSAATQRATDAATTAADPERIDPAFRLGALAAETVVYAEPHAGAVRLGYLRAGAVVRRAASPAGQRGCRGGWYRVEPEGYVCAGNSATLDLEHPLLALAARRPDRSAAMPYPYGRSRAPTPPRYARVPSEQEQRAVEHDWGSHRPKRFERLWGAGDALPAAPPWLAEGRRVPRLFGYPDLERDYFLGFAVANSAYAFLQTFEAEGRSYGLTTELSLVPLDRVTPVEASTFHGVELGAGAQVPRAEGVPLEPAAVAELQLPLVFVKSRSARVFSGAPEQKDLRVARAVSYREAFAVTGRTAQLGGQTLLETRTGEWVEERGVVRIEPVTALPHGVGADEAWLDVSIQQQTLVAYRGLQPQYATLVSTGRDGLGDPASTFSTVRGLFRIHTKHVTSTMSGDEADDVFDLADVPWVQYFHQGYALHAAFWHDGFGAPRSHGCINLAPEDARWLFSWTAPAVPRAWHSALSSRGTVLRVRP